LSRTPEKDSRRKLRRGCSSGSGAPTRHARARVGLRLDQPAGLGLAIARGLIEAQGGRIWAENRSTGGARVGFSLPVATSARLAGDRRLVSAAGR